MPALGGQKAFGGAVLMGIVNVTPDSFSDGGQFDTVQSALDHARRLVTEGAAIIDLGGESTRPGHAPVTVEEEQARVLPVLKALTGDPALAGAVVSIDTFKAATARAAVAAGARIINDIWGLQRDANMAHVVADSHVPVVVMHNSDVLEPERDIVDILRTFFDESLRLARQAGVPEQHIILDPGIGFGKTPEQGMQALRRLHEIKALGFPVLVGASRKSFIGKLTGGRAPQERLPGTLAAHLLATARGADILRVHDVQAHADALRVFEAISRA